MLCEDSGANFLTYQKVYRYLNEITPPFYHYSSHFQLIMFPDFYHHHYLSPSPSPILMWQLVSKIFEDLGKLLKQTKNYSWTTERASNFKILGNRKARYTLFANDVTSTKWRNKDVQRIVYSRCSPCFASRFFTVCCSQNLRRVVVSSANTKDFFIEKNKFVCAPKGEFVRAKIDCEQQI